MGTSTSVSELGGKLQLAARNVVEARKASFRTAQKRMQPRFRDQARQAAGGDRKLSRHRSKAVMDAEFKQVDTELTTFLYINPRGPWGIRDSTDASGKTASHTIQAKNTKVLRFVMDGTMYRRVIHHNGSARSEFWGVARKESFTFVQKRLPEDVIAAIEAALNNAGFKSRG